MNMNKKLGSVNVFSATEIDKLQSAISKASRNAKKSKKAENGEGSTNFSFFAYHR